MTWVVLNSNISDLFELLHPFKDFVGAIAEVDHLSPNLELPLLSITPLLALPCRLQYRIEVVMSFALQRRKFRPIPFGELVERALP